MNTTTIGQKIKESRKAKGFRLEDLAEKIGRSISWMSSVENNQLKGGPEPDDVIAIAEALEDDSILLHYIETNPVYRHVLPKIFPDLNNIRREPAIIFTRLAREAAEAKDAADILAEMFSNSDPVQLPQFWETFEAKMEQLVDIKRAVEIAEFQLLASGQIDKDWIDSVYARQQKKCEDRGHHRPDLGKTGTEG